MKITRLKVTNYRGIATLDQSFGDGGAIVKGGNARGKTSVLKAIRAALAAQDIGADAIRNGADSAEILVDMGDVTVRRAITRKASTLGITTSSGDKKAKPQAFLTELLGTSAIDPLELFLAKPKERRAQIIAAIPVVVTADQIRAWAPSIEDIDDSGHGLDVIERARKIVYDRRAEANAKAKASKAEADRLAAEAAGIAAPESAPSVDDATEALERARQRFADLRSQERQAVEAEARQEASRRRIVELREKAETGISMGVSPKCDKIEADVAVHSAEAKVASVREELERAESWLRETRERANAIAAAVAEWEGKFRAAEDAAHAANELESALDASAVPRVDPEEIAAAEAAGHEAAKALDSAKAAELAKAAAYRAEVAADIAKRQQEAADDLDEQVKALTNDAPAALLAASDGIPGLTIDGDAVFLDGVNIESLSGAEQMRFTIEIARRANAKSKILVVDGLERVDLDQMDAFVAEATRDGYQLLATKVDRGDIVIEAIETSREAEAAE